MQHCATNKSNCTGDCTNYTLLEIRDCNNTDLQTNQTVGPSTTKEMGTFQRDDDGCNNVLLPAQVVLGTELVVRFPETRLGTRTWASQHSWSLLETSIYQVGPFTFP